MAVCVCVCVAVFEPEWASVAPVFGREQASALVLLGNAAESVPLLVLLMLFLESF